MANEPRQSDDTAWKLAAGAAVALAVIYILIPFALALAVFIVLRGRLARRDWLLVSCGATVALLFLDGARLLGHYTRWLIDLAPPDPVWRFDVDAALGASALAMLFLGVFGLADGTALAGKVPTLFRRQSLGEKPSIVPTDKERKKISIASPVGVEQSMQLATKAQPGHRPVVLGPGRGGTPVVITEKEIGTHALIFGSTGSGKTETIKALAGGLLDLGWDGIVLDLKEDTKPGGLRDWCETYANHHGMRYQELRLSDPNPRFWFDALAGLSQDEARDTILSLTRFDDEYYKNVSIKVLGQLMKLMYWAHEASPATCQLPTLYDISQILGASSLPAATKKLRAIVTEVVPGIDRSEFQVLESPDQVQQNQAASWGAKLGNLYETQAGRIVLRQPLANEDRARIDVTAAGLIYIGLDSQGKPDLTKIVSSSVLQRISVESAQRTTGTFRGEVRPKFLIVDEANWVDRTIVQNLLSRARSAGVAMVLCTQGPKDWIDKSGDDFARLAQNTNIAMIMKQGEPDAAQICADFIGNTTYKEATFSTEDGALDGRASLRDRVDNIVSPDQLRELGVGEMILRVSSPAVRVEWTQVSMRDPAVGQRQSAPVLSSSPPADQSSPPPSVPGLARPPI